MKKRRTLAWRCAEACRGIGDLISKPGERQREEADLLVGAAGDAAGSEDAKKMLARTGALQAIRPEQKAEASRWDCYRQALRETDGLQARRIFCVPENGADLNLAVALKEVSGGRLAIYLTEDRVLGEDAPISRAAAEEAFARADLMLVSTPELRDAFENVFHVKFWILPPDAAEGGEGKAEEIAAWIRKSVETGAAADDRFEKAMPRAADKLVEWVEPPPPEALYGDFGKVYQSFRRLKTNGLQPDFVVDVGASSGIWSHSLHLLFPESRFILVDPLQEKYGERGQYSFSDAAGESFERVAAAASNEMGTARFQVSDDLWGSSLLEPGDTRDYETIEVEVLTLDEIAKRKEITGRGVLKIDVQHAEHIVLEGAVDFIAQVDALVLELSLYHYTKDSKILLEMLNLIDGLGFRYYDDIGGWRSPLDGSLLQKDCVFVRKGLCEPVLVG